MARPKQTREKAQEILAFVRAHPEMSQKEIAKHFGLSQTTISNCMVNNGMPTGRGYTRDGSHRCGRRIKKRAKWTDERLEWEQRLSDMGLGMGHGLSPLVIYGHLTEEEFRKKMFDES